MKADAILFDKDGTLMDFDAFWVPVTVKAIDAVLTQLHMDGALTDWIMEAIGVRDGVTDVDSVLCKGTYAQIGQTVHEVLCRHGCAASREAVSELVEKAYGVHSDAGEVKPTCADLADILRDLKKQDKKLAVITTDNEKVTAFCLKKLGVEELFDRIYTDDGETPTKPDPFCANDFCKRFDVAADRVVMVGDTMTDVCFARNAGIKAVAVVTKGQNDRALAEQADVRIPDLSVLPELLE